MRRKDKEIKEKSLLESIMKKAAVCRLAMSENNIPYVVPLNFAYKDGYLYLHSAREGRKIEILKKNEQVCFEIDIEHELLRGENACDWTMKYYSVIGYGRACLVDDFAAKKEALEIIVQKYSNQTTASYREEAINNVIVIKVVIDNLTGKKSGY